MVLRMRTCGILRSSLRPGLQELHLHLQPLVLGLHRLLLDLPGLDSMFLFDVSLIRLILIPTLMALMALMFCFPVPSFLVAHTH